MIATKNFSYSQIALALAVTLGVGVPAFGQASNAKGKISRNFYRIPYGNNLSVKMLQDYVDHGNTPAGDFGSMDMGVQSAGTPLIVAAAAGTVIAVNDSRNGCGCNSAYGPCANSVQIQHANGEVSTYLHIAQNSATSRGIANGVVVSRGQAIGVEGDVGWTCGGGSNPRTSTCVPVVPPNTGNCGAHLHWNVVRQSTGERVNPMTCGINNNLYLDDGTNTANACSTAGCATTSSIMNVTLNSFGEWRVFQADDVVTASSVTVTNLGSLVLHAGNKVRMTPGFHADRGGYVRAEIGTCNFTAFAPPTNTAAEIADAPAFDLSVETEGH